MIRISPTLHFCSVLKRNPSQPVSKRQEFAAMASSTSASTSAISNMTRPSPQTFPNSTPPSSFPSLFERLPPELRLQIWQAALPASPLTPSLFFYKPLCWDVRHIQPSEPHYLATDPHNLSLEFMYSRLDPIEFNLPVYHVSRESRAVATAWIVRQQGWTIHQIPAKPDATVVAPGREKHQPTRTIISRPFQPATDVLYISPNLGHDFFNSGYDRLFQPDLLDISLSAGDVYVKRIAMPEVLFCDRPESLVEIFQWFLGIRVWFVVVGEASGDLSREGGPGNEGAVQRCWRLQGMEIGRAFVWDRGRGEFVVRDGECIGGREDLYEKIRGVIGKELRDHLVHESWEEFLVQPVLTVRG